MARAASTNRRLEYGPGLGRFAGARIFCGQEEGKSQRPVVSFEFPKWINGYVGFENEKWEPTGVMSAMHPSESDILEQERPLGRDNLAGPLIRPAGWPFSKGADALGLQRSIEFGISVLIVDKRLIPHRRSAFLIDHLK